MSWKTPEEHGYGYGWWPHWTVSGGVVPGRKAAAVTPCRVDYATALDWHFMMLDYRRSLIGQNIGFAIANSMGRVQI